MAANPPGLPDGRITMAVQEKNRLARIWESRNLPERYKDADQNGDRIPDDTRSAYLAAQAKLRQYFFDPRSGRLDVKPAIFAILGPRGTGKTYMAAAQINELARLGTTAVYCEAMDYTGEIKETFDGAGRPSEIERRYRAPRVLVIDALEERDPTDWNDRQLVRLINKRYGDLKMTILISNQEPAKFAERVGPSVADRIREGGAVMVCDWESLRTRLKKLENNR